MSSKTTDETALIEVPVDLSTSEDVEGSSLESRSERIRRLNRERQRRRRMKLKMSRHGEPSMATEASNVSMNLDNLESLENANTGSERTENTVKVELDVPKTGIAATKGTRSRSSKRKRPYSELVSSVEDTNPGDSDAAAIIATHCHGPTSSNELSTATDQLSVLAVATEIEVFGDNPNVLNGADNAEAQNQLQSENIDEANKRSTRSRVAVRREDEEEPRMRRKRSSTNSEEEVTVRREKQRELKRKQKERMTPDQVEALRARYREWRRKRKEVMTSEQLEIIRRGNRERQRRRRERLGVRKRLSSSSSQGRGASEAVIQGLRNISQGRTASETSTSGESSKGSVSDLMSASGIVIDDKTAAVQAAGISQSALPTMVSPTLQQNATNQVTIAAPVSVQSTYNQVPTSQQAISTIPVIGPQGTILPGMPAGTFFPGVAMPGMQVFPGVPIPVTGSQANLVPGNPNMTAITTIPMSGVPGIQTAQGGFLSGIPVTSTSGNAQAIQQAFPSQSPLQREGQVLHNFQTLLPMTPVQASGQGMTFLTQIPFTGATTTQIQTVIDPKYTFASQGTTQIQGLPPGSQIVEVPMPVEDPKTAENPKTTQGKKPKARGRKRNTSAAEMLASLSTYIPQTSTPMSSMLSALASSARDRQATEVQVTDSNAQDKGKTETVVLEASNTVPQAVVLPQQGQVTDQQALNMYMAQQRGTDGQPFMVRTMVTPSSSTHSTIDVNSNNFALAAMNNGPTIPHMNTFLTAIGAGGQDQRPGTQQVSINIPKDPNQAVDVSVSTDNVSRVSKATNTDKGEQVDCSSSVGTMTDSLYRSSVATNTDVAVYGNEPHIVNPVESQR